MSLADRKVEPACGHGMGKTGVQENQCGWRTLAYMLPSSVVIVYVLLRGLCVILDFMGAASLSYIKSTISHQTFWSFGSCNLSTPLFHDFP